MYLSQLSRSLMAERHPGLGVLVTPDSDRTILAGVPYAADNGCFARGDRFDPARWLRWLERSRHDRAACLFAVAPDVVGDAAATLARSAPYLPLIRELGYPVAYAAQDGFDAGAVDWDAFDVLFIGGSTSWKRSETGGYAAIRAAHARGVPTHVGRVNGEPFLRNLAAVGVRSADGTQLTYRSMIPRTLRWLARLHGQAPLIEATA